MYCLALNTLGIIHSLFPKREVLYAIASYRLKARTLFIVIILCIVSIAASSHIIIILICFAYPHFLRIGKHVMIYMLCCTVSYLPKNTLYGNLFRDMLLFISSLPGLGFVIQFFIIVRGVVRFECQTGSSIGLFRDRKRSSTIKERSYL